MYKYATRSMRVYKLVGSAFEMYKATIKNVLPLAFALSLFNLIVDLPMEMSKSTPADTLMPGPGEIVLFVLTFLLLTFVSMLVITAIYHMMHTSVTKKKTNAVDSLKIGLYKAPKIIGAYLLLILGLWIPFTILSFFPTVFVGLIDTFVPFFSENFNSVVVLFSAVYFIVLVAAYFYVILSMILIIPLIVTEKTGIFQVLVKSFKLMRGNWWRTLYTLILFLLGVFVLLLPVILLVMLVVSFVPEAILMSAPLIFVAFLLVLALNTVFMPMPIAAHLVLFNDLKLRDKKGKSKRK